MASSTVSWEEVRRKAGWSGAMEMPVDQEPLPSRELADRVLSGEVRALARAITLVEAGGAAGQELLARLRSRGGKARVIGVTGPPGGGKSTLTDGLVAAARAQGERVAVVAVDPSSPFSGGAILGDRIRMTRWHSDPQVYIRSMATRGHLGGLAAATLQVVALLDAVGFDTILLETVGVGQSEVEIAKAADTTLLVLTPGQGDAVQAFKAGIMEIADLYVINKADQPGASRLRREIRLMLQIARQNAQHAAHDSQNQDAEWRTPILETIANRSEGVEALMEGVLSHGEHLRATGKQGEMRHRRVRFEIAAILHEELRRTLEGREHEFVEEILSGRLTPAGAVARLLRR
ncbi:MAG: methylmalonyl Co-A mutase-associated GTPase MeaB [Trueperaceae bacterium]